MATSTFASMVVMVTAGIIGIYKLLSLATQAEVAEHSGCDNVRGVAEMVVVICNGMTVGDSVLTTSKLCRLIKTVVCKYEKKGKDQPYHNIRQTALNPDQNMGYVATPYAPDIFLSNIVTLETMAAYLRKPLLTNFFKGFSIGAPEVGTTPEIKMHHAIY